MLTDVYIFLTTLKNEMKIKNFVFLMITLVLVIGFVNISEAYDAGCDNRDCNCMAQGGMWYTNEDEAACGLVSPSCSDSTLMRDDSCNDASSELWCKDERCYKLETSDVGDYTSGIIAKVTYQCDPSVWEKEKTYIKNGPWDFSLGKVVQCGTAEQANVDSTEIHIYPADSIQGYDGTETFLNEDLMNNDFVYSGIVEQTLAQYTDFSISTPTVQIDEYVYPSWQLGEALETNELYEADVSTKDAPSEIEQRDVPKYMIVFTASSTSGSVRLSEFNVLYDALSALPSVDRVGLLYASGSGSGSQVFEISNCADAGRGHLDCDNSCEGPADGLCEFACNMYDEYSADVSEECDEKAPNDYACEEKVEQGRCGGACGLEDTERTDLCSINCGSDDVCDMIPPGSCSNEEGHRCTDECNPESVEDLEDFTKEFCWGTATDGSYWPECCYDQDDNDCDSSLDLASADCGNTNWVDFINGEDPFANQIRTEYGLDDASWDYWQDNYHTLIIINPNGLADDIAMSQTFAPSFGGDDTDNTMLYAIIGLVVIVAIGGILYFKYKK